MDGRGPLLHGSPESSVEPPPQPFLHPALHLLLLESVLRPERHRAQHRPVAPAGDDAQRRRAEPLLLQEVLLPPPQRHRCALVLPPEDGDFDARAQGLPLGRELLPPRHRVGEGSVVPAGEHAPHGRLLLAVLRMLLEPLVERFRDPTPRHFEDGDTEGVAAVCEDRGVFAPRVEGHAVLHLAPLVHHEAGRRVLVPVEHQPQLRRLFVAGLLVAPQHLRVRNLRVEHAAVLFDHPHLVVSESHQALDLFLPRLTFDSLGGEFGVGVHQIVREPVPVLLHWPDAAHEAVQLLHGGVELGLVLVDHPVSCRDFEGEGGVVLE
mmetsp:Transcript_25704/g.58693  ORF Transcript_25704/g.58693 Transcript_25704/m.58693 type:complete len:321 (-) Transcript_25704:460-1422(-)